MESINDRILTVFNSCNIKQFEFANRIGVSQAYISKLFKENSDKTPSERVVKLICSEFNISEEWLMSGIGEMKKESKSFSLDEYANKQNLSNLELDIIKGYMGLDSELRQTLMTYLKSIFDKHSEITATSEDDIEKELRNYRLELEAEKKGITSSVIPNRKENLG